MVAKIETSLAKLQPSMSSNTASAPSVPAQAPSPGDIARKALGEIPPEIVDPSRYPQLAYLLAEHGIIQNIQKRLRLLSGKGGKILLAKNTIASADNKGQVYLGAAFLEEHQNNPALIAGVMTHEWGHLVSNLLKYGHFDQMSWDELMQIRREEEAAADAFCGKYLPLLGYSVEPIIEFLMKGKDQKENHKYYNNEIRAEIIREAARQTLKKQHFSRQVFTETIYPNPLHSKLFIA